MSHSSIIGADPVSVATVSSPKKQRGHVLPRCPLIDLNQPGRLRSGHVLALCGISHSTLYKRLKESAFPQPDGKDGGLNFWNTQTIKNYLQTGAKEGGVE